MSFFTVLPRAAKSLFAKDELDLSAPLARLGQAIADGVIIQTPPEQWDSAASCVLDFAGLGPGRRRLVLEVDVAQGELGVGWLAEDGRTWIARTSIKPGEHFAKLTFPADIPGRLILDNFSAAGPTRALIRSIRAYTDKPFRHGQEAEVRRRPEAAIAAYRKMLKIDPTHVESIAALGRLQFAEPEQPFYHAVRASGPVEVTEFVVEIRNPCNYRCFYCVAKGRNNVPVQRMDLEKIEAAYQGAQTDVIVTLLECGGGEPTVHPQFPDLVRIAAKYGAVSFPTNNSQNPKRWLPRELASRFYISSSFHPEAEENIDAYIENALYLMEAGARFDALYVCHPTRLDKLDHYKRLFAERGVSLVPIVHCGYEDDGRHYPQAYTEEELVRTGIVEDSPYWFHRVGPYVGRQRNFSGIPCLAGYRSIYVAANGDIQRCCYDRETRLDAPYRKVEPCTWRDCTFGLRLEKLNIQDDFRFHNTWSIYSGVKPLPTEHHDSVARSLGYDDATAAEGEEAKRMYDALMSAYGKDEDFSQMRPE